MASKLHSTRKDGKKFNPASKTRVAVMERERQVWNLRIRGLSYEQIAQQVGTSAPACYEMMMRILDRMHNEYAEKASQMRRVELARCDRLLLKLDPGINAGDVKAIRAALQVSERRSRLLGLDAPVKVNPVDDEGRTMDLTAFRTIVLAAEPQQLTAGSSNGHVVDAEFEEVPA